MYKLVVSTWYNLYYEEKKHLALKKLFELGFFPNNFLRSKLLYVFYEYEIVPRNSTLTDHIKIEDSLQCQFENVNFGIYSEAIDIYNLWTELGLHELISFIFSKCTLINPKVINEDSLLSFSKGMLKRYSIIQSIAMLEKFFEQNLDFGLYNGMSILSPTLLIRLSELSKFFSTEVMGLGDDFYRIKPSFEIILKDERCRFFV